MSDLFDTKAIEAAARAKYERHRHPSLDPSWEQLLEPSRECLRLKMREAADLLVSALDREALIERGDDALGQFSKRIEAYDPRLLVVAIAKAWGLIPEADGTGELRAAVADPDAAMSTLSEADQRAHREALESVKRARDFPFGEADGTDQHPNLTKWLAENDADARKATLPDPAERTVRYPPEADGK